MKNHYTKYVSMLAILVLTACGSSQSDTDVSTVDPITMTPPVVTTPEVIPPVENETEPEIFLPETEALLLTDEISPHRAVAQMGVGINLGNTFDAPNEGDWALPAKIEYLEAFKSAGFKHVRIPVTWHEHTLTEAPYTIDPVFLDRVEQVVDWALALDLYVILNAHHEAWLKNDYQNQINKNRFDAIWIQVAARFKTKSAKLILEMLNEPHGMTMEDINGQNIKSLAIIRNENPNRLVVFSGNGYTPIDSLLETAIPDVQDKFLIGNFHSYDPWQFAGQCQTSWGSDEDKQKLTTIYQKASDWALIHQIPVMVNEFAAAKYDFTLPENVCSLEDRLAYIAYHVFLATEQGIAATYWDDGGSFSTFDRSSLTWDEVKVALTGD